MDSGTRTEQQPPDRNSASLLDVRVRYWIERRLDAQHPWVAWREGPEPALENEYRRLTESFSSGEWRFGKTTETVEVLAEDTDE